MSTQAITTRNDIHKSCKTFEAVVNYLNDYSEAVTAIIGIQKKLAKALRDAASTKTTSEVAGTLKQCKCEAVSDANARSQCVERKRNGF